MKNFFVTIIISSIILELLLIKYLYTFIHLVSIL